MSSDLIATDLNKWSSRLAVGLALIVALFVAWFGVRWQLGDLLANLTAPTDQNAVEIAALAKGLAPSDPLVSRLEGSAIDTFGGGSSVEKFEQTVRFAPYDYRWRVNLGGALEDDDQLERAEAELKRAVDLAPSYAYPRWHLGNFYLRHDRRDDAFAQLKKASENNSEYRDQVFSLAWEYFNKDGTKLESLVGEMPETRASLAYFFAAHGRAVDSLRNWNLLGDQDKLANRNISKSIALGLYEQRHFAQALEFSKQNGNDLGASAGVVTNAGFETSIESEVPWFGWQIARNDPKIEISADSKIRHLGDKSLKINFRNYVKSVLSNISQLVVVDPGNKYQLRFFFRTENLKSSGALMLELVNANDEKLIIQSKPLQMGTDDWQEVIVDFTVPANCDGVQIRTIRSYCGESCPINGTLWYDDFSLTKV